MIISNNTTPSEDIFRKLLNDSEERLRYNLLSNPGFYLNTTSDGFEEDVFEAMNCSAKGTQFDGSIELVSGHRFPDIVAKKYYGVEVKTTKLNHWQTLGNSVLESTRVAGVEKIYIFFGKLISPADFKIRKYQDCLSDVAITHSPRYLIDMELPIGNSIFDKMKIAYDDIRRLDKPIAPFISYYKKILGNDSTAWWLNNDVQEQTVPLMMQFWKDLEVERRKELLGYSLLLFPELFDSKNRNKYNQVTAWLAKRHSVISTCMRDAFSAGGKIELNIAGKKLYVPHVINTLFLSSKYFKYAIQGASKGEIIEYLNNGVNFDDTLENRWIIWRSAFRKMLCNGEKMDENVLSYIESTIYPL